MLLPVSVPAHSALMQPAGEKLRAKLAAIEVSRTTVPVYNVDITFHGTPEEIRDAVVRQLSSPVQWVQIVRAMLAAGADHIVECGPGKVLAGLSRRIDKNAARVSAVTDSQSFAMTLEACNGVSNA